MTLTVLDVLRLPFLGTRLLLPLLLDRGTGRLGSGHFTVKRGGVWRNPDVFPNQIWCTDTMLKLGKSRT